MNNIKRLLTFSIIPFFSQLNCYQYQDSLNQLMSFSKNIYCSREDDSNNYKSPHSLLKKVDEIISNPKNTEIWIASFDISDTTILKTLCRRLEKPGFKLKVIMHESESAAYVQNLIQCLDEKSEFYFKSVKFKSEGINTFHAKMIITNPNEKKGDIVFGSSNLTSGLWKKHENINVFSGKTQSSFFKENVCAYNAMFNFSDNRRELPRNFEICQKKIKSDHRKKLYFIPGQGEELLKKMAEKIINAKTVQVASHHLSLEPLIYMLESFLKRGGDLTLYLDGGYFESFFHQSSDQKLNEALNILNLLGLGAKIIPIYTNQAHGSVFHHKFLIMDQLYTNEDPIVVTGSANFSHSGLLEKLFSRRSSRYGQLAFKRKQSFGVNIENIYFLQDKLFYSKYKEYLEQFNREKLTSLLQVPFILEHK